MGCHVLQVVAMGGFDWKYCGKQVKVFVGDKVYDE